MSAADERQAILDRLEELNKIPTKAAIRELSPYNAKITEFISSVKEVQYYMMLGLRELFVERWTLAQKIDMQIKDSRGRTNAERMSAGLSPILSNGDDDYLELHHLRQDFFAPFAELSRAQHHGTSVTKILHPYPSKKESWRNDPEMKKEFTIDRARHWKVRVRGGK